MLRNISTLAVGIIMTSVILPTAANGSDLSRAQYVDLAEPICKVNTIASRNILKGTRQDIRNRKLRKAGRKFRRAALTLQRTIRRLEGLPRPQGDEVLLARWFRNLTVETTLLRKVALRLLRGRSSGLARYVLQLRHRANVANNVVLTFGFEFCLIQTARYL